MPEQDQTQHMLECEARTWLRNGYDTPERIEELTLMIAKKRGQASAERLVEEMALIADDERCVQMLAAALAARPAQTEQKRYRVGKVICK